MHITTVNYSDVITAALWISKRTGSAFPVDWLPKRGLAAYKNNVLQAVVFVYLDNGSPSAVTGWCATNPDNTNRESYVALETLFAALPQYARQLGVKHLLTTFGNRGVNRILAKLDYRQGDTNVQHKYMKVR